MNLELYRSLLDAAVSEITNRHPDYFLHYSVSTAALRSVINDSVLCPSDIACLPPMEFSSALEFAVAHLRKCRIHLSDQCVPADSISETLARSIMDGLAAAHGIVPLETCSPVPLIAPEVICGGYLTKTSDRGVPYLISPSGEPALLVISAIGLPLNPWLGLLDDRAIGARPVVVENAGTPLFDGGMVRSSDIAGDVDRLIDVIESESLSDIHVLAWCSGARVAIELARRLPDRVRALLLLGPTFHGTLEASRYPSPFEDNLKEICTMWGKEPEMGARFIETLRQKPLGKLPEFSERHDRRADSVLQYPPHAFRQSLFMPFMSYDHFQRYIARAEADRQYDVRGSVLQLKCPIWLLTGTHDGAINTDSARNILAGGAHQLIDINLFGAGHHIHLLQYPYFQYVLRCFIGQMKLRDTARLGVRVTG